MAKGCRPCQTILVPASCSSVCPSHLKTVRVSVEDASAFRNAMTRPRSAVFWELDPEYLFVKEYIQFAGNLQPTLTVPGDNANLIKTFLVPRVCVHLEKKKEWLSQWQASGVFRFPQASADT